MRTTAINITVTVALRTFGHEEARSFRIALVPPSLVPPSVPRRGHGSSIHHVPELLSSLAPSPLERFVARQLLSRLAPGNGLQQVVVGRGVVCRVRKSLVQSVVEVGGVELSEKRGLELLPDLLRRVPHVGVWEESLKCVRVSGITD